MLPTSTMMRFFQRPLLRGLRAMTTAAVQAKKEGDISSVFVGLSGSAWQPLPERYAALKARLIAGHEDALQASWTRLLEALQHEIPLIASLGSKVIPEIDFTELDAAPERFRKEHRKRGVAVIRNVVPDEEALRYKADLKEYIARNPHTKAFPRDTPQVFELYWSASQIRARAHPNVLKAQKFLMEFWHSADSEARISSRHPTTYADRLRIRLPGDNKFALGPHVDGGSVERWEEGGYGLGHVYDKIYQGRWEEYDPFESSCRLSVKSDLYNGAGACSMFRMYQGWLSMSTTGPHEGTLLVNPLLGLATSYYLLRPFFDPINTPPSTPTSSPTSTTPDPSFLSPDNWRLNRTPTTAIPGANPGHCQELTATLHPHLLLPTSMVHIPRVSPGDYVAWHCDTVHAVDGLHAGSSDSSVLYIPACPLTEANAAYLSKQREAFVAGTPGPDFPGGEGERRHLGRLSVDDVMAEDLGEDGMRAFGLEAWDSAEEGMEDAERELLDRANKILGFYD